MVCSESFVVKLILMVGGGGGGVLWVFIVERARGFGDGNEGIIKRTLGVVRFLFCLEWIICLSFVDVWFWFWLGCLVLLKFRWRDG